MSESLTQRTARIVLLSAATAGFLFWFSHHAEVSFADGLRYVREAQLITRGDFAGGLWRAIDHPMHALAIAAMHTVIGGGDSPFAWQTAAQAASVLMLVMAVPPIYLVARELYDETTAVIGCILVFANPVITYVAVNVLSESTFLVFWSWGLWGAVRFLREGRFVWLPPTIGFGALAYLTRPEGLLLHGALVATLLLLPLHRVTRIHWPRWRSALAFLVLGPALLVGPYIALKGGLGTKPAIARVLGFEPEAPRVAPERENARTSPDTMISRYSIAFGRMLKAIRGAVTLPMLPLAVLGLCVARPGAERARIWLFSGVIVITSAIGLVRLHATGGYCTVRHALVPGLLLTFAAAHGLAWLIPRVSLEARVLGLGQGRLRPGPAVWGLVIALLAAWPLWRGLSPYNSSFAIYRMAGSWLAEQPVAGGRVLDLTDWSLFFAERPGDTFASVLEAPHRTDIRYVVLRDSHLKSHSHYSSVVRTVLGGRRPVARFPEHPGPQQLQVAVYDLTEPLTSVETSVPVRR